MTEFKNEERSRYYGLRVGDKISYSPFGTEVKIGIVTELGGFDNNRVYVYFDETSTNNRAVAEWCTIVEPVEDKSFLYRYEVRNYSEQYTPELEIKEYMIVKKNFMWFLD